jgi:2,3-dihydroxybenzoate decarboxylase
MHFSPRGYTGKRYLGEYFKDHFHVTTSGNFCDPAFHCCLEVMGADRVLFSADYPFETMEDAAQWFDNTPLSDSDRLKIGRTNAIKLFGLDLK